ncbi:MAG: class I SAM-dependent methyltransferase [Proteobacteria bacterium]|nr:class I SAM-dependent methyltransferase [Pseudomonadota bacterium]
MSEISPESNLLTTREFWDANPCGVHDFYEAQVRQRYAMEPWLPAILERIAKAHGSILEIGCGQGIDSTLLCRNMAADGRYCGIDFSPKSVAIAQRNAATLGSALIVRPDYRVGNAEALEFPDASFDAVYSMGVIHHTADDLKAYSEVRRVLRPGGKAYLLLYRRPSLKVGVAQALRAVQAGLDAILRTDRVVYSAISRLGTSSSTFGTMFHECFGVPYMKWYSRAEMERIFDDFAVLKLEAYGPNLGRLLPGGNGPNPSGYFWLVEATK